MMSSNTRVPVHPTITASFCDYDPPFDVVPIVRRMLDSVPEEYLLGLNEVILTNAKNLSRSRRRSVTKSRGRKVKIAQARGLYHQEWRGKPARIEIFVDNTLKGRDRGFWLKIPLYRKSLIGDVLFHEIGHHIHFSVRPEFREGEDVADVWKVRLQRNYGRQRFRWMVAVGRIIRPLFGTYLARQGEKLNLKMLKNGQISRAEYLETKKETRNLDRS